MDQLNNIHKFTEEIHSEDPMYITNANCWAPDAYKATSLLLSDPTYW